MSIKITDYRESRGHGQKSIWFIFCLWVALSSKQTDMGLAGNSVLTTGLKT